MFQPFFVDFDLPVALTRDDEATVPVVVYNYLDEPQTVELTLADQPALTLLDEATQKIELAPREVRAAHFRSPRRPSRPATHSKSGQLPARSPMRSAARLKSFTTASASSELFPETWRARPRSR